MNYTKYPEQIIKNKPTDPMNNRCFHSPISSSH